MQADLQIGNLPVPPLEDAPLIEGAPLTPAERLAAISVRLVESGHHPADAAKLARLTQALFPDVPLGRLSIFTDRSILTDARGR